MLITVRWLKVALITSLYLNLVYNGMLYHSYTLIVGINAMSYILYYALYRTMPVTVNSLCIENQMPFKSGTATITLSSP